MSDLVPTGQHATERPARLAYSPAEAAAAIGVSRATIYNLINRGELTARKVGRATRIARTELERLAGITPGDAA